VTSFGIFTSIPDPDVLGTSGSASGSVRQRYGSEDQDPYRTVPKCHGSPTLLILIHLTKIRQTLGGGKIGGTGREGWRLTLVPNLPALATLWR
jgi:hypothetical protein